MDVVGVIALLLLAVVLAVLAARQLLKGVEEGARRQHEAQRTKKTGDYEERRILVEGGWHTVRERKPRRPDPSNWR